MNILINSNVSVTNYIHLQLIIPAHDVQVDKLRHSRPAKVRNQYAHILFRQQEITSYYNIINALL
jgi:hypothetical protein